MPFLLQVADRAAAAVAVVHITCCAAQKQVMGAVIELRESKDGGRLLLLLDLSINWQRAMINQQQQLQ